MKVRLALAVTLAASDASGVYADWGVWRASVYDRSCVLEISNHNPLLHRHESPTSAVVVTIAQAIAENSLPPALVDFEYSWQKPLLLVQFAPGFDPSAKVRTASINGESMTAIVMNDLDYFHLDPEKSNGVLLSLSSRSQVVIVAIDSNGKRYEFTVPDRYFSITHAMWKACIASRVQHNQVD